MKSTKKQYPVFEANQVLTHSHLNQAIQYLDEQERLTRANLIGIGIVCGLELKYENSALFISKGCGISSEGYLLIEPDPQTVESYLKLSSYRDYTPPAEIAYAPFSGKKLWELLPNDSGTALNSTFLTDKVVLLFLELSKTGLRNCSPNNCDDKGAAITTTVRPLLISKTQLDQLIAAQLEQANLATHLSAQLNLPELRLPRYNVPSSQLMSSNELLAAFLQVFTNSKLVTQVSNALTQAYQAFLPILKTDYPSNPFLGFSSKFSFLNSAPSSASQVRFLPYYYDFFDDLIKAYNEFRDQGMDLLCACCPAETLFPRHLMLGLLVANAKIDTTTYRQHFLASSALSQCETRTQQVIQLFQRLVAMIERLTNKPLPATSVSAFSIDSQIRITPSQLGDVPLSKKAIPYYYLQEGKPALYQLWNPDRTQHHQAKLNLSYRADEYAPPVADFVSHPLRYDLEPYNFLRIEGHLGKNYQSVLKTLLTLKADYRLPIDVIALRAGAFDENITIDLSKENCRFDDLEMLYDVQREQILSSIVKTLTYFYQLPFDSSSPITTAVKSQFALINQYAPDFLVQPNTLGREFEDYIIQNNGIVPEANANLLASWINIFAPSNAPYNNALVYYSLSYLLKLADSLPKDFLNIQFDDVITRYNHLYIIVKAIEKKREQGVSLLEGNTELMVWEEIDDYLEDILKDCQLDALKAIHTEYLKRIKTLKKKQFLGNFLTEHTGIQHKAGVPLGGTFIVVYHQNTVTAPITTKPSNIKTSVDPLMTGAILPVHRNTANLTAFKFVQHNVFSMDETMVEQNAVKAIAEVNITDNVANITDSVMVSGAFADLEFTDVISRFPNVSSSAEKIIASTVKDLLDGTVIADFYLPYLCHSDCPPIQFVLPKIPPSFTVTIGCTQANQQAAVTVSVKNAMPPYRIKIDNQDYQNLLNPIMLTIGSHTLIVQDANDGISAPQTVTIAAPLSIGQITYNCDKQGKTYRATVPITGGTPPYSTTDSNAVINGSNYVSAAINSGSSASITIIDQKKCTVKTTINHTCPLPCDLPSDGLSRRCAYRLWLQTPTAWRRYQSYQVSDIQFRFNNKDFALPNSLLHISVDELNKNFSLAIESIIKTLNEAINKSLDEAFGALSKPRLLFSYQPTENDPFELMWIEHFIGDSFNMEFDFVYDTRSAKYPLHVRYSNEVTDALFMGMTLINLETKQQQQVPAFDCSERNQCTGSEFVKLCQGFDLKPAFVFDQIGDNNQYFFAIAENMPKTGIVWVWDFSTITLEPFYTGNQIEINWQPNGFIRLTAITDKGCFSSTLEDHSQ